MSGSDTNTAALVKESRMVDTVSQSWSPARMKPPSIQMSFYAVNE
jgi:hypothetical protein